MTDHEFQLKVTETLAEMKTMLIAAVGTDGNGGKVKEVDTRVDELERKEWQRTGFASAISAAAGIATTLLFGHRAH